MDFQFTTSQGGRQEFISFLEKIVGLSIHDLTRRSTKGLRKTGRIEIFQFTTSQGGRQRQGELQTGSSSFNSRPHKEVDIVPFHSVSASPSFNSRPHKEVDVQAEADWFLNNILSIHDLTRRSTLISRPFQSTYIFQFTTSQGGRLLHNP